ncbi:pentapeptide repeat-containing protein [Cytobacillus gottheilii]|uniref:pentapeptide repeat-containing protein n=1 Tax=Cytobacillus gottheilii TaxID=859144 RepID=UPI0035A3BAAD
MTDRTVLNDAAEKEYKADCLTCFGLCCVALPYAKSADFAYNKDAGTPCRNLQGDFLCSIHENLRGSKFRGCAVYECFGAGQKVSQVTFGGRDWRQNQELADEMFQVFPIMQQLHEMLMYVTEALSFTENRSLHSSLLEVQSETESITFLAPKELLKINIDEHRAEVNELLLKSSKMVRSKFLPKDGQEQQVRGMEFIGAKLAGKKFRGKSFRGALLIAADLRNADLRMTDMIGADLRDADLSGANLTGSFFLTQAQLNAAIGNKQTLLPKGLEMPEHWRR